MLEHLLVRFLGKAAWSATIGALCGRLGSSPIGEICVLLEACLSLRHCKAFKPLNRKRHTHCVR